MSLEAISKISFRDFSSICPLCKALFAANTWRGMSKKSNAAERAKT